MLSSVRSGVYLRRKVREFLADFGTTIAIILMLVLSLQFKDISISRLEVPDSLEPSSFVITEEKLKEKGISDALSSTIINNPSVLQNTNSSVASKNLSEPIKKELETIGSEESKKLLKSNTKRSWFVNPFDAPSWVIWSSIIPALLLSILLYLDQNITVRLVNHSQYKLQKGSGYHLDLFVVAILVGVCSLLGLPWMVAATVRSLNHVRSLIKVDENAQEEVITGTVETRMTGLFVHILVGISLLLLTFLQLIPMAVLFGLFLYMGFASMKGNQLFERIKLWFMDPSKYPSNYYLKVIPTKEIHKYTFIQSLSLGVLWIVKTSAIAILFPLFIAFLVPIRMALNKFFTHSHLALLDAEETPEDEEYREND